MRQTINAETVIRGFQKLIWRANNAETVIEAGSPCEIYLALY